VVKVSASQLEGWVFDSRPLSEFPQRSIGKERSPQRPRQEAKSGFGLPLIAVAKINNKKVTSFQDPFILSERISSADHSNKLIHNI